MLTEVKMHYQNFNDKLEKAVLTFLDFWTQMEYRGIDPIAHDQS